MSEKHIVQNCAPTLAGLKTGNIFQYPYENKQELIRFLREEEKRKIYEITDLGTEVLQLELKRIRRLYRTILEEI